MATSKKRDEIRQVLEQIEVSFMGRTIGELNMIRALEYKKPTVKLSLARLALKDMAQSVMNVVINRELKKLPGVENIEVGYEACKPAELNNVKHVIAVMSGKGGVGKSTVSGLIAAGLRKKGKSVGVLDADVIGPSIPKLFGITERPIGCAEGIIPVLTSSGIRAMSVNLVLENEEDAVIWRGPMISNAIKQFWDEVFWGNLDYLIVDLPPGTSDVALTVLKSLPVSGVVMVFTPQDLTAMMVKKAINMTRELGKGVLGTVENMSYLYIEDMERKVEVFGPSKAKEIADMASAPLLAQLPIDPALAKMCDEGRIEEYQSPASEDLVDNLLDAMPVTDKTETASVSASGGESE